MKQYIDKDKVIEELKKRIEKYKILHSNSQLNLSKIALKENIVEYNNFLSFLDTLETKEVDVEKESELIANSIMISVQANLYHTNVYNYEKRCYKHSDLKDAARKGIELGLKAQKGE